MAGNRVTIDTQNGKIVTHRKDGAGVSGSPERDINNDAGRDGAKRGEHLGFEDGNVVESSGHSLLAD
jgi:hypothetical protein